MKTHWLTTAAAVAILVSAGLAAAQGTNERGGKSPGAAEKSAPSPQTQRPKAEPRKGDRTQSPRKDANPETTGQSPPADRPSRPSGQQRQDQAPGNAGQAPDSQRQPRTGAPQKQEKQGTDTRTRPETTGRGDASGASLTVEQRTKIRQVVVSKKIPKVARVNFTVSIGAKVPRTVRFYPIPVEIVEIYPAWRGYRVILVGSELVVIHPTTFEIIAVIVV